jgi:pimeloyl-ACP methyl ester carboxylesterase
VSPSALPEEGIDHDVVVEGQRLRVREAGRGPTLLLVHGLGADRRIWQGTMRQFADRWRVVAVDLPGHGESEKPDHAYTPEYFARVLRGLGRALRLDDVVVVGSSLGGRVTLELAASYPAWVRAIVLSAPAPLFGAWWKPVGWALPALAMPEVLRFVLPRGILRGFFDPNVPGASLRYALIADQLARDDFNKFARAVARSVGGIVSADAPALASVKQPALLVWGAQDRVVSNTGAEPLLAALPQARLHTIDRCGHMPMLERPDVFHGAVAEFLLPLQGARTTAADGGG